MSNHVAFVVNKAMLWQIFPECFGFLYQFSFHRLLHNHPLSSGAGTMVQLVVDVPSGLSLNYAKLNSVALVRKRTIPTTLPSHVGEVSANFCGRRVSRGQRNGSPRPLISIF
jgi:hypothetical protein